MLEDAKRHTPHPLCQCRNLEVVDRFAERQRSGSCLGLQGGFQGASLASPDRIA